MPLNEEQLEQALKMALAVNARLEREKQALFLERKAEQPPPAVMAKLELDLDRDGQERLVRVLRSSIITHRQARDRFARGRSQAAANDCEARAQELELAVAMLEKKPT